MQKINSFLAKSAIGEIEYVCAENEEVRQEIFRLRYLCYHNANAISTDQSGAFQDDYDNYTNARSYALRIGGELAGSLRLHFLTKESLGSPSLKAFQSDIQPLLDAGAKIIDPTRFVISPVFQNKFRKLPICLLRLAFMAAEHFGADFALAAVRESHMSYYKRILCYEKLSTPKSYPGLNIPLGLMYSSYSEKNARVVKRYPEFDSTFSERQHLFGSRFSSKFGPVSRRYVDSERVSA